MQGELNFVVPGLETPLTGTWIAVNKSVATDETKAAFGYLTQLAEESAKPKKDVTLESLLEATKIELSKAS